MPAHRLPLSCMMSAALCTVPLAGFALPLAAIPGTMIERPSFVIEQTCGGDRKTASLEPFLVPTLEDDDEPEEVEGKGNSTFERPVKGRMPIQPKTPAPDTGIPGLLTLACYDAKAVQQRRMAEEKEALKHLPPMRPKNL